MNNRQPALSVPPLALVIDDDLTMRLLLRQSLEQHGFRVEETGGDKQALEILQELQPDVILLDIAIADMDGYAFCRQLRQQGGFEDTPVVIITGSEDVESVNHAYKAGATDFFSKPINWTVFGHRMRYILRSSQAFAAQKTSEARSNALLRAIPDMIFRQDGQGRYLDFQGGRGDPLLRPPEQFIGKTMEEVLPREIAEPALQHLHRVLSSGSGQRFEYQLEIAGTLRYFEARMVASGVDEVISLVRDITDQKLYEDQIQQLAFYDNLTDLPNRRLFFEHLEHEIRQCDRSDGVLAILFLDLDRFKLINDTLGHSSGDAVLAEVGRRLTECVRSVDAVARPGHEEGMASVARLGGDEFTMLIAGIRDARDSEPVARRILEALSAPITIEDRDLFVTPSIGIATYPVDGDNAGALLKNADAAMYKAKEEGRNCIRFYSNSINDRALSRFTLEADLRAALEGDELEVHYQPQVDMQSGKAIGMEALVRWNHPQRGFIPPSDFIPVAEEAGLIDRLGEWVMQTACAQARAWCQQGAGEIRVAVNLSPRQFYAGALARVVADVLVSTGLPSRLLEVELTEGMVMKDPKVTLAELEALKEMGVSIAVDDFGTGHSSLAYLKKYPLDVLKIDRSFVNDIATDPDDAAIARAIIVMAKSLGMAVIGEGVETGQQLTFLQENGCDQVQGYLPGRPVCAREAEKYLHGQRLIAVPSRKMAAD